MPLVTRILPPDAKNAKLTFQEMDNNLYYLQSLGVSGLTFSANTLTITNPTGGTKSVTINANSTFTGGTVSGPTIFTNGLSANTISATTYQNLPTDVRVTGGTFSAGTITFTNNTGGTFNVTGLTTGSTSTISGDYLPLSGGTVTGGTQFTAGLSANTISATTYQNLPTDIRVTGGTYSNGTASFTNNTGGTFNVNGFYTGETSYVNSLSVGVGLSADTTTGDINLINTDPDQVVVLNDGSNISVTGTYPNFTIEVTGLTDLNTFTTGFTYLSNTFTILDNSGNTFDATFTDVTGLTINGDLMVTGSTYSNIISATTYQNLPDNVTGLYLPLSGGTVSGETSFTNGLTANTISATTYLNLPVNNDVFVTGGTYSAGTSTFTNNTGGTFNVNGFYTGETSYVNSLLVGVGLSANTTTGDVTIINSSPDQPVILNNGTNINVTGTYPNFTIDVTGITDNDKFTTAFTYNNNTFTISDNSGSTFNSTFNIVTGLTVNGILTVTGNTNITNGLSANTLNVNGVNITGDTYVTGLTFNTSNYNLTIGRNDGVLFTDSLAILASDLTVTGGTYNPNTGIATFTNNTGGTFNVTGFITGLTDTYVTGGTYSNGTATFTNTSGGTFNVSGFYTGGTDIYTTGVTYDSSTNTITLTDNTNNSLNTYIDGFSGLTVNGTLSATTLQSSNTYIESTGYLYFGDSSTDGSWRMSISGANFIVEKRVGGNWIISGTFN